MPEQPDSIRETKCASFIDPLPLALRRAADFIEENNILVPEVVISGENEDGEWIVQVYDLD